MSRVVVVTGRRSRLAREAYVCSLRGRHALRLPAGSRT